MKKNSGLFGIEVGAFDGAEVCKLVDNFLLHKLSEKIWILLYTMMIDWQFLRMSMDQTLKKLKNSFVNCL